MVKCSNSEQQDKNIIGPFNVWQDVPHGKIMKVVDGCHAGKLVIRPNDVTEHLVSLSNHDTWSMLPQFSFEIMPKGFKVTLEQE